MATPAPINGTNTFCVLACESQQEFNHLLLVLREQNSPANAHQEFLVRQLATSQWLIARAQRFEAKALEQLAGFPVNPDDPESRLVAKMFETNPKLLATLQRQLQQAEQSYYRAWRELKSDQKQTDKSDFDLKMEVIQKNGARIKRDQKILNQLFFDPPSEPQVMESVFSASPPVFSVPLR
jgi:hypothetical protein